MNIKRTQSGALLKKYSYFWPQEHSFENPSWQLEEKQCFQVFEFPENLDELKKNSSWPALFPSPICIVTTTFNDDFMVE